MKLFIPALTLVGLILGASVPARAQYSDEHPEVFHSPENWSFEIRIGTYHPSPGPTIATSTGQQNLFDTIYSGDHGPLLALELQGLFYRIRHVGMIGAGLRAGWARYTGMSCPIDPTDPTGMTVDCTMPSGDKAKFRIFPLTPVMSLRIDVLARETPVPLVITPKLGLDMLFYTAKNAGQSTGSGVSIGLNWGIQVALELDFLSPRRANALDEDWGINHTYLFGEIYGSTAGGKVPLRDPLTWCAGLGMTF